MRKVYDAIIIGSGAAAYSAADWLYKYGVKNVIILSENRLSGTSRNTGSDKQTYYKLSMDGKTPDSPYKMACDIYSSGCADGEKLYLQSVLSTKCFLRLCDYGVNFPTDRFGAYPGYKTDHDNTVRATSVGPLTSKLMTQVLEKRVIEHNKTDFLDNRQVVEIITDNGKAFGVVALNKKNNKFEVFASNNVICATGAPACIYESSVYPVSQHGMTGIMIKAGAGLCNFTQWQYGLASTDFRWNVSGSFMQVIPRFVSVDDDGNEYDFLADYFDNSADMCNHIFLKGYQWPFSYERIDASSRIDVAVHNEIIKGKKVFLDFINNPKGFSFDVLSEEAKTYLIKNEATSSTPIERLQKLNKKAIDVYARENIDLYSRKLRIAVCAQHNNGGIATDCNYETDVSGLYAIGEAAGTFGLARPGGTALNDTQAGGLLCAKHICMNESDFDSFAVIEEREKIYDSLSDTFITDKSKDYSFVPKKMSVCAAFIRDKEKCENLLADINSLIDNIQFAHISVSRYFYDYDMLISAKALLEAIVSEMPLTGSRGGAVFYENGRIISENKKFRDFLTLSKNGKIEFVKTSPVPVEDEPFEKYLNSID